MSLNSAEIRSTQDSVVGAIQNAVFRGDLKLGERILEDDLSTRLGISRATLREALRRLEQVGLVQIKARRGTFVTRLTLQQIERTCRLRSVLEGLAARYAKEQLTPKDLKSLSRCIDAMRLAVEEGDLDVFLQNDRAFHSLVWTIARDSQLEYILRFLSTPYFAFIASVSTYLVSDVRKVLLSHEAYLKALQERHSGNGADAGAADSRRIGRRHPEGHQSGAAPEALDFCS
jgi:DNA-binding GntR family transcriptional regulator